MAVIRVISELSTSTCLHTIMFEAHRSAFLRLCHCGSECHGMMMLNVVDYLVACAG